MKYKGFEIVPIYYAGSGFRIMVDRSIRDRKQTSKDIEYYEILDNGERWIAENTIQECKNTVNNFLEKTKHL